MRGCAFSSLPGPFSLFPSPVSTHSLRLFGMPLKQLPFWKNHATPPSQKLSHANEHQTSFYKSVFRRLKWAENGYSRWMRKIVLCVSCTLCSSHNTTGMSRKIRNACYAGMQSHVPNCTKSIPEALEPARPDQHLVLCSEESPWRMIACKSRTGHSRPKWTWLSFETSLVRLCSRVWGRLRWSEKQAEGTAREGENHRRSWWTGDRCQWDWCRDRSPDTSKVALVQSISQLPV